jgi:hypothetical protein
VPGRPKSGNASDTNWFLPGNEVMLAEVDPLAAAEGEEPSGAETEGNGMVVASEATGWNWNALALAALALLLTLGGWLGAWPDREQKRQVDSLRKRSRCAGKSRRGAGVTVAGVGEKRSQRPLLRVDLGDISSQRRERGE